MANSLELINLSAPVTFKTALTSKDGRHVSEEKFFTAKSIVGRVVSEATGLGTFTVEVQQFVREDMETYVAPVNVTIKTSTINSRQRVEA